jgi:hypothetical protein
MFPGDPEEGEMKTPTLDTRLSRFGALVRR